MGLVDDSRGQSLAVEAGSRIVINRPEVHISPHGGDALDMSVRR